MDNINQSSIITTLELNILDFSYEIDYNNL
jgi:hypothetical protein